MDAGCGLHALVHDDRMELLELIQDKTARIAVKTKQAEALSSEGTMTRRLKTIPRVGPLTALAVETFAPPMESFKSGLDFAAWLGIVPRQHSSGGKQRLGKISKAGHGDIRRLLILGAMTRLTPRGRLGIPPRELAGTDAGTQAEDAGGDCFGQQDGPADMGLADES